MPSTITNYKVFIASPEGLDEERRTFRDVVREYNEVEAVPRRVLFWPVGWEDTLGGVGRPQGLIDDQVRESDFFVLVLWDRWGSPTSNEPNVGSTSGSKEEFDIAVECHAADGRPMRRVVIAFKGVDPNQMKAPGSQLRQVLDFRKEIQTRKEHLYETFDTAEEFASLLRRHLASWRRSHEDGWTDDAGNGGKMELPGPSGGISEAPPPIDDWESSLTVEAWKMANEGRLLEAEVEFAKAVVVGDHPESMVSYAHFLRLQGRFDQSTVFLRQAIRVADEKGDNKVASDGYAGLGNVLYSRGEFVDAEEMFRKSLEINEGLGRLDGMANNYGDLGNLFLSRGDLARAEDMHRNSLAINEKLNRSVGVAIDRGNLGAVLQTRGDLEGAEEMHRESLEINERLGRQEGVASQYGNLGIVLEKRGDFAGAEEAARKSLEINESLGRQEGMANQYGNLGIVLHQQGDLIGAQDMYLKSLTISERIGLVEHSATQYGNLGIALKELGDLAGAEEMYRRSLGMNESLGRPVGMADAYGNLGNLLQERGDLLGAEEMHRKSLEIEMRMGRKDGMASDFANLGIVLQERGDLTGAEEMYRKSIALAEEVGLLPLIKKVNGFIEGLGAACPEREDKP